MKRIEEVCRLSGVSRRTLQYYDNEGILSVKRSEENYRLYDETAMARLWEILWYKEMGFELKEIKNILTVTQKEKNNYLNEKIQIIEGKIQDLEKQIKFIRYIEQYGIIPIPINEKEKNITYKEYIKKITGQLQTKKNRNFECKNISAYIKIGDIKNHIKI